MIGISIMTGGYNNEVDIFKRIDTHNKEQEQASAGQDDDKDNGTSTNGKATNRGTRGMK